MRAAIADDFRLDWGGVSLEASKPCELIPDLGDTLTLYCDDSPWGHADKLEAFCREHGLWYRKLVEGKYEYLPEVHHFEPGTGESEVCGDDCGTPVISLDDLREAWNKGKTLEQVIAELDYYNQKLPAFEVSG